MGSAQPRICPPSWPLWRPPGHRSPGRSKPGSWRWSAPPRKTVAGEEAEEA
jgi:hypothetical protein